MPITTFGWYPAFLYVISGEGRRGHAMSLRSSADVLRTSTVSTVLSVVRVIDQQGGAGEPVGGISLRRRPSGRSNPARKDARSHEGGHRAGTCSDQVYRHARRH